jgi:hypothetical protein
MATAKRQWSVASSVVYRIENEHDEDHVRNAARSAAG